MEQMESASDKLSDENTSHLVMVHNNTTNAISFIGDNISVEAFSGGHNERSKT